MDNIYGDSFLGNAKRGPAWHRIGGLFQPEENLQPSVAIVRANMDYEIEKVPLFAEYNGAKLQTNQVALVREPTTVDPIARILAYVHQDYGLINNRKLAESLDRLTSIWPLETVLALGKGESVVFTFDAGEMLVGNEEVRMFFLVNDNRNGAGALNIAVTPVRVVCQNTLVSGLAESVISAALTHRADVEQELDWRIDLVSQLKVSIDKTREEMEKLTLSNVTKNQVEQILKAAYPMPKETRRMATASALKSNGIEVPGAALALMDDDKKQHEYRIERAKRWQGLARDRFGTFNEEFPKLANTPWAVYNAVVETEDYRGGASEQQIAEATLFGKRADAKKRAFKQALKFSAN